MLAFGFDPSVEGVTITLVAGMENGVLHWVATLRRKRAVDPDSALYPSKQKDT